MNIIKITWFRKQLFYVITVQFQWTHYPRICFMKRAWDIHKILLMQSNSYLQKMQYLFDGKWQYSVPFLHQ
jgi:hypothetical protein